MEATHVDLYQLTSLVPHFDAGLAHAPVTMSFFSRRVPSVRPYLVWCGLRKILAFLDQARFTEDRIETLLRHPMLGSALEARPALRDALKDWRFEGTLRTPPEGTPIVYRAMRDIDGVRPTAGCPYLQVDCDVLTAKLIETPLLSIINHMTMVASKARVVAEAAKPRAVLEFGQRRTHPEAAVDAAYAAWVGGVAATSNVEAHHRHGVPVAGTMDHFAIQAWERPGVPRRESEAAYFRAFFEAWPDSSWLLVDTYDTFEGIRSAVEATQGRLAGVRLDSQITRENVRKARQLLDDLGAPGAKIAVSGGMDEHRIRVLGDAPVDVFGIGERIVTSPDAPVGVGAVGKLALIDGRPTMKLSKGSPKATLPGRLQVFRRSDHDLVALADEDHAGRPLLRPPTEDLVREDLAPDHDVRLSEALQALVRRCVHAE